MSPDLFRWIDKRAITPSYRANCRPFHLQADMGRSLTSKSHLLNAACWRGEQAGRERCPIQFHKKFAGIEEEFMKRGGWWVLPSGAVMVAVAIPARASRRKKLVFWTHWETNPDSTSGTRPRERVRQEGPATRSSGHHSLQG